jgi:hypothetical protein
MISFVESNPQLCAEFRPLRLAHDDGGELSDG